ncbi:LPXTG cell wall anchor domain-containing protein [Staphylococcus intermedius]|uniref:LPXTG-motif cell wall anchor domain-containing protein n=1 Tax=Staphylococcus intermedius NCTC 11048 TaxID=1141106 RepID=A0A380G587_STAIN|nr:LPXTG cell wall anchor domain-containing protein [Staphylococcus intermedius]PCF64236.1 hypothetical protein B5C04_09700 [Staphylococcus intermedius]PCF78951.1 hypothetical protein B4W74_10050 [Staphylococcus intermedius]PCF79923.1 hypothetical protein B4W70_09690 [Staphylococcus intermedius]PCF89417.1 hypothetical protein B4W75_00855 [Staphylococcus intermedius]PNZ53592.1 peptidase [Staphylococcus intermedius NCTC 11048]
MVRLCEYQCYKIEKRGLFNEQKIAVLGILATFSISHEVDAEESATNNVTSNETNSNSEQAPRDHYIRKSDGTIVEPNVNPHKDYVENEEPLPEIKVQDDSEHVSSDSEQASQERNVSRPDGMVVEPHVNPNKDNMRNEAALPESKGNEDVQQHAGSNMQADQNAVHASHQHENELTPAPLKELPQTGESNKETNLPIIYTLLFAGILVLWKFKNK